MLCRVFNILILVVAEANINSEWCNAKFIGTGIECYMCTTVNERTSLGSGHMSP